MSLAYHIRELSRSHSLFSSASKRRVWSPRCFQTATRRPWNCGHARSFSQTSRWAQQKATSDQKPHLQIPRGADNADSIEPVKPETVKKTPGATVNQAPNTDGLLSEQTVSNKEQRRADWAIMKEMVQYLWPKVGQEAWEHRRLVSDVGQGRYGDQS